ncbi:FtsQ-type POTRA domain-containing protein [Thalassospiraceae bacterium LMO-SO8]|nr:FtsQ-type POTRA domain-containing protein [Alphaproteobacteria bacterium LMO-S08]WND74791.1 FtsQ-type POTRA domain-containing protein [Thalassospiraceae bacterium LMO-SO8]
MAEKKTEANDTQAAGNRRARKPGAPRKRVLRGQVSRAVGVGALVAVLAGAGGGGWWVWSNDVVPQLYTKAQTWTVDQTAEVGLRIDDIFVTGRSQTTRDDLLAALRLTRGAPIFGFDPDEARERVEKLPWVKRAVVERMLPGTVMLHIEERSPLALWQNKGVFHLIDDEGVVILNTGLERFSDLPIVVGPEAPRHARALLETLKAEPDLMNQVRAAVWVSGRRWTLTLENGIDVQLPEDDPGGAWLRLAEYERQHKVLDRDVEVLDLRLPDRLIVRKAAKPRPPRKPKGQET